MLGQNCTSDRNYNDSAMYVVSTPVLILANKFCWNRISVPLATGTGNMISTDNS